MTVTIGLKPEEEKKLAEPATASGQDLAAYPHQLIRRDIEQASFADLFASVHQAVRDSKMSAAEVDSLIETAIVQTRQRTVI